MKPMTKEDLYERFTSTSLSEYSRAFAEEVLDAFFESNVCIPKGENRHPYADVLHAWLEGTDIEWHSEDLDKNKVTKDVWYSVEGGLTLRTPFSSYVKYRIKPSEPVYEWQWKLVLKTLGEIGRTSYMTKEEFQENISLGQSIYLDIDEETKRVRQ